MEVRCMMQGTQSRCSGITQRDKVGRQVEGGVQDLRDMCVPVADSC